MGKTESLEEPEQLSLEEERKEKTKSKRDEEKNRKPETKIWAVVIFVVTIVMSLVFYFISGKKVSFDLGRKTQSRPTPITTPSLEGDSWGTKVYEF